MKATSIFYRAGAIADKMLHKHFSSYPGITFTALFIFQIGVDDMRSATNKRCNALDFQ